MKAQYHDEGKFKVCQMLKISYSFPNGREQTGFQEAKVSNQVRANEAYCTLTEAYRNEIRLPGEILKVSSAGAESTGFHCGKLPTVSVHGKEIT
jgi:hypothetical protein